MNRSLVAAELAVECVRQRLQEARQAIELAEAMRTEVARQRYLRRAAKAIRSAEQQLTEEI